MRVVVAGGKSYVRSLLTPGSPLRLTRLFFKPSSSCTIAWLSRCTADRVRYNTVTLVVVEGVGLLHTGSNIPGRSTVTVAASRGHPFDQESTVYTHTQPHTSCTRWSGFARQPMLCHGGRRGGAEVGGEALPQQGRQRLACGSRTGLSLSESLAASCRQRAGRLRWRQSSWGHSTQQTVARVESGTHAKRARDQQRREGYTESER